MPEPRCPMGHEPQPDTHPYTGQERPRHENIFAERPLVGNELAGDPRNTDAILQGFELYVRDKLQVGPTMPLEGMRLATQVELVGHLEVACHHAKQILAYDLLVYERLAMLQEGYQPPLPKDVQLDHYQVKDTLQPYPHPIAMLLTSINNRLLCAVRQRQAQAQTPSSPTHSLFAKEHNYLQQYVTLWNKREQRRAVADPNYKPRTANNEVDENNARHVSMVALRENVHATLRNSLPWLAFYSRDPSSTSRDITAKLLENLATITRPTGVKVDQTPHTSPFSYQTTEQRQFAGLLKEAVVAISHNPNAPRPHWTSPHLQDTTGPWNNPPHYEADPGSDAAAYPYPRCIAFFPVPRWPWVQYMQTIEQVYGIQISLRDPNGYPSIGEILAAEMAITTEAIMNAHPSMRPLLAGVR